MVVAVKTMRVSDPETVETLRAVMPLPPVGDLMPAMPLARVSEASASVCSASWSCCSRAAVSSWASMSPAATSSPTCTLTDATVPLAGNPTVACDVGSMVATPVSSASTARRVTTAVRYDSPVAPNAPIAKATISTPTTRIAVVTMIRRRCHQGRRRSSSSKRFARGSGDATVVIIRSSARRSVRGGRHATPDTRRRSSRRPSPRRSRAMPRERTGSRGCR